MTDDAPNPPRPRGRLRPRAKGFDDVPVLSDEEVERRVGLRGPDTPKAPIERPAPLDPEAAPTTVVRTSGRQLVVDPRRILWRDSASILVLVVLALLGFQTFLPRDTGSPLGTPLPSTITIGSLPPGVTLPPGATFGDIIDPSLGIDATATPIPVITLGPSPSPSPSPTASVKPSGSPKPSPKPSKTPTPTPTVLATPEPTPAPTPTPPPVAHVTCDAPVGLQVTCTSTSSNILNNSESWDMGGLGLVDSGGNGSSTITFTYTLPDTYTVTLTVTGLDGVATSTDSTSVTVAP